MSGRRRRSRPGERELKDKVLHARIPDQLDRELRDRAGQLGLSVSTVVRNVLLHTFDLVEGIVTDSAAVARAARGQPASAKSAPADEPDAGPESSGAAVGWQEISLNINALCEDCNEILPKGEQAGVGVPIGQRPMFLCPACLDALRGSAARPTPARSATAPDPPARRTRRRGAASRDPSVKSTHPKP